MRQRSARLLLYSGVALAVLLILARASVWFYTDLLWFAQLGYADIFWRRLAAGTGLRLVTGLLGATLVLLNLGRVVRHLGPVQLRRRYGNIEIAEQVPHGYVAIGVVLASVLAGWWLSGLAFPRDAALGALAWLNRGTWGETDPLFQRDLGFYVFSLPLAGRLIDYLLLVMVWSAVLALVGYVLVGAVRLRAGRVEIENQPKLHFALLVASLILLFAARYWIARYDILLDGSGFGGSVGYTDVHARLPGYLILSLVSLLAAAGLVYSAFERNWLPAVAAVGALLLAGVGLGIAYPSFIQKLRVVPNQLAREEPYLRWHLEFTRRAWNLHHAERTAYATRPGQPPAEQELATALANLPLWDPEPLQTVFNQRESRYGYYHFPSVHFDRYGETGRPRQVGLAVREFTAAGLDASRRTWQTLHLNAQQVRGIGAVAAPVSEKTADGSPVLWDLSAGAAMNDLSTPASRAPGEHPEAMTLTRPSVFFGETAQDYLLLNTTADTTSDEAIAALSTGIQLGSFVRVLAWSWRFGDRNLLFSGERTSQTRLLYRRSVHERVRTIAPFAAWDPQPHPVVAGGRVVWILDGYTFSPTYPISRPLDVPGLGTVRYIRNSLKATVDGLSGRVQYYAVDPADPVLAAYRRALPGLVKPLEEMPEALRRHLRYPLLLLAAQADILEEYHVDSPAAFFAGENEWQIPQQPAAPAEPGAHAPVYMMAELPGSDRPEFLLVMPFIARQRQNMTAILMVQNDPAHYGAMTLLELGRNQQISGPRQVRSLVEQDPAISAQLSLWRRGNLEVEMGRLRVVPLEGTFLYVQPVFLSGQGSSIPQLQRVIASDGTSVVMAETLEAAARTLFGHAEAPPRLMEDPPAADAGSWARRALELMQQAERAVRNGDWAEFGRRWTELQELLRRATGTRQ